MNQRHLIAALLLFCLAGRVYARGGPGFYVDISLLTGMGNATLATDKTAPLVGSTSIGATLGITFFKDKLIVGLNSDYTFLTQWNTIPSTEGNRRGSYLNPIGPTLAFRQQKLLFKANFKLLGSYSMLNPTISGPAVSYSNPFGVQFVAAYAVKPYMALGLFVDYFSFSQLNVNGQPESTGVALGPLKLLQGGVGLILKLDKPSRVWIDRKLNSGKQKK